MTEVELDAHLTPGLQSAALEQALAVGIRAEFPALMDGTVEDAHNWLYRPVRPEGVPTATRAWRPGVKVRADCSTGYRDLCWFIPGAPDPFKNGWAPYGNSSTIWLRLHHVDTPAELEVGDPVAFGIDGRDHIAAVREAGPDPLLWSDGRPGAPNFYRLSQDGRIATYCKLPVVDPPPTPQDKLRAMTGFYAWMAWQLAEGPWRHYVPRAAQVRPDVPKRISADWWIRREIFLKNRLKPNAKASHI